MMMKNESNECAEKYSLELNVQSENLLPTFFDNQCEANAITERFFEYLRITHGTVCDDAVYSVNGIIAENYPPYYAGAYINRDGNLVLQIVDQYLTNSYRESEWYQEFVEIVKSQNFICHAVQYSYTELINAISKVTIGSFATKYINSNVKMVSAAINDYSNRVEIKVRSQKDHDALVDKLKEDIYWISVTEDMIQDQIGLYPGEGATISSLGPDSFSVACRVRKNEPGSAYSYGFLTCAHAFSGTTNIYLYTGTTNNTLIGISYLSYQHNSGNADVAFISANTGITLYDTVFGSTTTLYHSYSTVNMGSVVYKRGAGTSSVTNGVVQSTSFSLTQGGINFTDLVLANYYCVQGDSGGIIYTAPNETNHAYPVGIHKGGDSSTGSYGYYTKIANGIAALQSGPIYFSLY